MSDFGCEELSARERDVSAALESFAGTQFAAAEEEEDGAGVRTCTTSRVH